MVAYEFYWQDQTGKWDLIGVLPERRKDPLRITQESIINWGKMVASDNANVNNIYFIQIEI